MQTATNKSENGRLKPVANDASCDADASGDGHTANPAHPVATRSLAEGLVAAQRAVEPAPKTARNTQHSYDYASADTMIRVGREALSKGGISLSLAGRAIVPMTEQEMLVLKGGIVSGESPCAWLDTTFVLQHALGQNSLIAVRSAIIVTKGRPIDKAAGGAETKALADVLRGLLLIDRVKPEEDVDAARGGGAVGATAAATVPSIVQPASAPPPAESLTPVADCADIVALADKLLTADQRAAMATRYPNGLSRADREAVLARLKQMEAAAAAASPATAVASPATASPVTAPTASPTTPTPAAQPAKPLAPQAAAALIPA